MELRSANERKRKNQYSPENKKSDQKKIVDRDIKRKKAKAERIKAKKIQKKETENIRSANLGKYKKMNMSDKIRFARAGYRFFNNSSEPAIELSTTSLETSEGMDRGIKVGKGLPFLPIGFIILYSYLEIVKEKSTDIQRCYQVSLHGGKIMKVHAEPTTEYGAANFINSVQRSIMEDDEKSCTAGIQNMKIANCELVLSQRGLSKIMRQKYPAYVKVIRNIPQGHELLMRYGTSFNLSEKTMTHRYSVLF